MDSDDPEKEELRKSSPLAQRRFSKEADHHLQSSASATSLTPKSYLNKKSSRTPPAEKFSSMISNKANVNYKSDENLNLPKNAEERGSDKSNQLPAPQSQLSTRLIPKKVNKFKQSSPRQASQQQHDLYIELEVLHYSEEEVFYDSCGELSNYHWKIVSRWIKYEQTIDPETNIWSKPFVGALLYPNLVYLKNTLQYGTILLNSLKETFESVIDDILQDFCVRGHMNREFKERLKVIVLSQHRSQMGLAGVLTGKKQPISELFSSNWRQSRNKLVTGHSMSMISRNQSTHHLPHLNHSQPHRQLSSQKIIEENINMNQINEEKAKTQFYISNDGGLNNPVESNAQISSNSHFKNNRRSTLNMLKQSFIPHHSKSSKANLSSLEDIEVFLIMVGVVEFLDRPGINLIIFIFRSMIEMKFLKLTFLVMAFVRLTNDQYIDHFIEYQIKVRFIFLFLGPSKTCIDYYEVGRCMGAMMADKDFQEMCYGAKKRQDLIRAITNFSNKSMCLVMPLGEFDDYLLSPMLDWMKKKTLAKMVKLNYATSALPEHKYSIFGAINKDKVVGGGSSALRDEDHRTQVLYLEDTFDPFKRTGCPFGSLFSEIKHRYKKYLSDIQDGLNLHCFISSVFLFTVCVAPALCFGGLLADKTDQWFGVNEMLLATAINGVFFGLFSGQPLLMFGPTGPFVVFEEMLYNFCVKMFCIEFLATRCWISIWILIFTLCMLAFESVFVIHYVTRFTEEIFAILIACVFLADAIKKIFDYFTLDPIYKGEMYCEIYDRISSSLMLNSSKLTTTSFLKRFENQSLTSVNTLNNQPVSWLNCKRYQVDNIGKMQKQPEPNLALISVSLLIGTCVIALVLKKLRRSRFFGSYIRRTLSDVGILISIVLMVLVDFLIKKKTNIDTQKLEIPENLVPTKNLRVSWFVSPFGNNYENFQYFPWWVPFASIFPASIIFIVLFFEIELTSIILCAKHRKLIKGTGFNLDLLLGSLMMVFNSFFGLPWLCAAPVRTLAHWASLSIYSSSIIPGEKPKLIKVLEQRITNVLVHIAIGLCLKGKFLLRMIPVPAMFGIILYFGIVSLSGTQFFERIKFIFIPYKYCPNMPYLNGVRPSKRNFFTLLQIAAVATLLALKSHANISFVFPVVLLLLVPFRKFVLSKVFTSRELEQLDDEGEHFEDDITHDFYELTHLPI